MWTRLAPLVAAAVVAFIAGAAIGGGGDDPRRSTARAFAAAWERSDYAAMHALLTREAQRRVPLERFAAAYRDAAKVVTLSGLSAGGPGKPEDGIVPVPVVLRTRIFGTLSGRSALPVVELEDGAAIDWRPYLVHPGLRPGEKLSRTTSLPPRAAIQARDGTPLAEGEARVSKLGAIAADVAGRVGPAPAERAAELARRGVPADASVGLTGLEREFDAELTGRPGGVLRAGDRVLASVAPRRGSAVRTTIDPEIQSAAVTALAGRFGGVAVIRPSDGEVLALAGIAYSAPQPPGSVFKIITLAAALEAGVAKPSSDYPVQTAATLEGVQLENAHGESCGGSLKESFAHSCNSVFAPLGAEARQRTARGRRRAVRLQRGPGPGRRRCPRRSRQPTRSATTSRSARPRSARDRCSRPRWRSPAWPGRSRWTACSCARRCARERRPSARAPRPSRSRGRSAATCAPS